ncbi:MAG TPA: helix-turn-helix transcriptional regulator, partial [Solirubrobacteraceae bacterium]|nr:helix-turn-helix transcriptional regulator [Solirubrobacteraceae bacterium]
AAALLGRCEGVSTPALADANAAATLTRRERDIAQLAARGLSNREIADRLVVSVRTVESHLAHAYTKLAVNKREDLAEVL